MISNKRVLAGYYPSLLPPLTGFPRDVDARKNPRGDILSRRPIITENHIQGLECTSRTSLSHSYPNAEHRAMRLGSKCFFLLNKFKIIIFYFEKKTYFSSVVLYTQR